MSSTPQNAVSDLSVVHERERAIRIWQYTTWIAVVFSVVLGLAMLLSYGAGKAWSPLKSPELSELKEKLRQNPTDEQLKSRIRSLDLKLRQSYFLQLSRTNSGIYLLLGGLAIVGFSATRLERQRKQLPMPGPKLEETHAREQALKMARWSVGTCGASVALFLLVLSLKLSPAIAEKAPENTKPQEGPGNTANDFASAEELLQNWPRFRGPAGNGFSLATNSPTSWDATNGTGVVWKIPSPTLGFNSPVVWGNRLYLSGGNEKQREVVALDTASGQLVWRQAVVGPQSPAGKLEIPDSTGYAASSMATDGRRIYVFFANGDLGALSLDGKVVWSKNLGPLKNPYGHATSLATWKDQVIVQLDQGESEDGKSKLYAFNGRNGQIVWQQARKVGSSWASPVVYEAGGKPQIVTLAVPWAIAYSAIDGAELWRVDGLNGEITPSAIFASGLVIAVSPSEKLLAIRPDGQGDVTKSHIAWTAEDNVPDVTSPAANQELMFALTTSGTLTCFDLKDGKKQWEHDFEFECHASPSIAGNRVYVFGQKGTSVIVEAARQFKEVFRTEISDKFSASPAIAQDKIFLRGVTNVWCFGGESSVKLKK